jgi:hypothetical protein
MSAWDTRNRNHGAFESCPDAALLAAFGEGQVEASERESITDHLLQCERCYFAFTESARISDDDAPGRRERSRLVWERLAWAAALIMTTAVLTSALLVRHEPQQQASVSAGQEPSLVAGPRPPDSEPKETAPISKEQSRLWTSPPPPPRPGPSAAVALSAVLHSHGGVVNAATAPTQRSDVRTPSPQEEAKGQALNALAEFHLRRWQDTKSSDDAVVAFEQSQRAVASNPRSLDARINMALALEALSESFRREARKAWEEYLTFDSTSSRAKDIKGALETDDKNSHNSWLEAAISNSRSPRDR